ncbi:MAG: hypothetical protein AAF483_22615 [Planctomycetota bacterium]
MPSIFTAEHAVLWTIVGGIGLLSVMLLPGVLRQEVRQISNTRLAFLPFILVATSVVVSALLLRQFIIDFPLLFTYETWLRLGEFELSLALALLVLFSFWFLNFCASKPTTADERASKRATHGVWGRRLLGVSLTLPLLFFLIDLARWCLKAVVCTQWQC